MTRTTTGDGPRAELPLAAPRRSRLRLLRLSTLALGIVLGIAMCCLSPLAARSASAATAPGTSWTQIATTGLSARRAASMAYDPRSAQIVLFGGTTSNGSAGGVNDTDTFAGSSWTQVQASGAASSSQPSARSLASMAYDPATQQMVLFGGIDTSGNRLSDTWVWSGSAWSQVSTASGSTPSIRSGAMLEWDAATGQLVLFGGYSGSSGTYLNDTWLWSGTGWSQQSPSGSLPPVRSQGSLTYSPATGQLVLFGGQYSASDGSTALLNDTWLWTGTAWQATSPAASPAASAHNGAAFDPYLGRIVLTGGCANYCTTTWSWSGTTWRQESTSAAFTARSYQSTVFDPRTGQIVLFGGYNGGDLGDTWAFGADPLTAQTWTKAASTGPGGRAGASMAFDAATGQLVLFGGYDGTGGSTLLADTWVWDGSTWTNVTPSTSPPPRKYAAMAYDPETGQLLLFGGRGTSANLADTWSWSSSGGSGTWTNVTPASGNPAARFGASAAYDPASGQMMLFGGSTATSGNNATAGDTWDWTGAAWSQLASDSSVTGSRSFGGLVFDASLGQMVLEGGVSSTGSQYTGTFTWNASSAAWVNQNISTPSGTSGTARDFDPVLGRTVIWDPKNGATLTYSGTAWSTLATTASPPTWSGSGSALVDGDTVSAFDPATGQLVVIGGWTGPATYGADTWVLGYQPEIIAGAASTSTTLNGYDQSIGFPQTIQVNDPGTTGWNVTVTADRNPTASSAALPALKVTAGSASSATSTSSISPTCASGSCTAASTGTAVSYPLTMPTSATATLYSAAGGSGVGRIGLPIKFWATVPANTRTGTYVSTVTVTVSSGP